MPAGVTEYLNTWEVRLKRLHTAFQAEYTSQIKIKRYYEITYCIAGEITYHVGAASYTLHPGDILLLSPGETFTRSARSDAVFDRLWIGFEREWLERIGMERLLQPFESRLPGQENLIHPQFFRDDFWRQILAQLMDPGCDREIQVRTCVLSLLWTIYEVFFQRMDLQRTDRRLSKQIVEHVDNQLPSDVDIDDLARRFYISRASLYRLFKAETGEAIGRYITEKRLQAARELMIGGVIPKKACILSGFNDYSTFYRAYRRKYGIAPSDEVRKTKEFGERS